MIKVKLTKTIAEVIEREPLTSGMVGQTVQFEYSDDFDGLTVTAVFTNGTTTKDVLNPSTSCTIPHEVLTSIAAHVRVGIYAYSGSTLVIPTIYADLGIVRQGADPSDDTSTDPTLAVWAQIQANMGSLSDLATTAKTSLVAAINEAAEGGGGGSANAVLYTAQTLTDEQKAQARNNIGAGTNWSSTIIDAFDALLSHVKYTDATGGQLATAFIALLRSGQTVTVSQSGSTLIFSNVPAVSTITQTGSTLAFA